MSGAASYIDNDVVYEALDKLRLCRNSTSDLASLFTIEIILAPLVDSAVFGKAQSVICAALNL